MAIRLIIDSAADLSPEEFDGSVKVLPCPVYIDGKSYLPYVNINLQEFYKLQYEASKMPTTGPVDEDTLRTAFNDALKDGDEVLAIFMASEMSITYDNAKKVQAEIGSKNIYVIDSECATFPYGALVLEAYKMIKEGTYSIQEINDRIKTLTSKSKMLAVIDDVTYLKLGGRSKGPIAVIANFLNFKPIITITEGDIKVVDKERGRIKVLQKIIDFMMESDIDTSLPMYIGHSDYVEGAEVFKEYIENKTKFKIEKIFEIGPTVGTHAGPRSVGISYFVK